MGPLANPSLTSPQATRCPPRALGLAAFDGRCETKVAFGAASSPPARPLLPVGQWVARKSVEEGIGWAHSPIPASRALRRRGALRGPWDLAAFDGRCETKEACGAASSPPARPLLPVGQWVARKSVEEGIGWVHSPIPASRALRRRGALREALGLAAFDGRCETKEACGAASSPPARPLLPVGQWVARKSVGEGIGWAHSPIPASRALRRRGALRGPWVLPPSTAGCETKVAFGAASSPPARPLLPVGQWVARKSVGEGIGWAHSPIPASRALRRRGALRGPWVLPPSTADVRPRKLAARRARHRPVRCSQWVSGWLGSPWGRALGGPTRQSQPHEPSGDAVPSAGLGSCRL